MFKRTHHSPTSSPRLLAATRPGFAATALAGFLAAALIAGCQRAETRFVSYRDPYFPEPYQVDFGDCVYRISTGGDLYVVGHALRESKPGIGAAQLEPPGGRSDDYLQVHVYWKPLPGKTWCDATMTDALITYVVSNERGALTYLGTGFVYPKKVFGGVEFGVESGRLRLVARAGEIPDILGDARLTGVMHARQDAPGTVDLVREAQVAAAR